MWLTNKMLLFLINKWLEEKTTTPHKEQSRCDLQFFLFWQENKDGLIFGDGKDTELLTEMWCGLSGVSLLRRMSRTSAVGRGQNMRTSDDGKCYW